MGLLWGAAAGGAAISYLCMLWPGLSRGDTNHRSTFCGVGKCPGDLQHCLGRFLSCPPCLALLQLLLSLGQPSAPGFPAAGAGLSASGRLSCPYKERFSLLRFVEHRRQAVAQWGKEDEEEQLRFAAFNCSACRASGVSGSWLPELWIRCWKTSLPTLVKETGPCCWGCPWSLVACKEVLVDTRRRDAMVPLLKLRFLIQHVSRGRNRANHAAVNQGHVFLSGLPGQQRKENQQAPELG